MTMTPEPNSAQPMQVVVTAIKSTNFGDHGAMMRSVHLYDPDERVEDLVKRLLVARTPYESTDYVETIELQVATGTAPVPTPAPPTGLMEF